MSYSSIYPQGKMKLIGFKPHGLLLGFLVFSALHLAWSISVAGDDEKMVMINREDLSVTVAAQSWVAQPPPAYKIPRSPPPPPIRRSGPNP